METAFWGVSSLPLASVTPRLVPAAVRESKWVPLPLCRSFLVGEPFMAQLGLLKVSELLDYLYCSKQGVFFFFLVSVYGTKLKAGGKWRRTAEWGWALLDFLSFSFCFFLSHILFLVCFRTTKRTELMNHREMASILTWSSVDLCGGGMQSEAMGDNSLLNSYMALKEFAGMLLLVLCEPQLVTHCQEKRKVLYEACFYILHYALTVCMEVAALLLDPNLSCRCGP